MEGGQPYAVWVPGGGHGAYQRHHHRDHQHRGQGQGAQGHQQGLLLLHGGTSGYRGPGNLPATTFPKLFLDMDISLFSKLHTVYGITVLIRIEKF